MRKQTTIRSLFGFLGLTLIFAIGLLMGIASPQSAQAAINKQVNFQGRLTDANGNIVGDGVYNVEFKLMSVSSGGDTTQGSCTTSCVWMETRTSANRITVSK